MDLFSEERRQEPRVVHDFDPEGFAHFWSAYPRHDARKDAIKAWNQVRPTPETQDAIHLALVWQKHLPNWLERKQFIPLAGSYLRGERWTDERPASTVSTPVNTARLTPFQQARRAGLK